MIRYVLLLLAVIHLEVSNAMQIMQIGSSEWEGAVAERRMVLESETPLESPVPSRHSRTNHSLVAAIVVLMVVATAALICCCYMWEQQLRVRMEARNREPASLSLQDSIGVPSTHHRTNSRMVSASPSTVIVLIGDDRPSSMAWAIPPGIPTVASAGPQAAKQNSLATK